MSIFNRRKQLSVAPFSDMPAIDDLPAIMRPSASVTASVSGSVNSATFDVIARNERCLITKSLLYTNEGAYWISAVRSDEDRKVEIEEFIINLGIVYPSFEMDEASNLVNLDCGIHKCLDSYALIAVTGTAETLKELTKMVKEDNDKRQLFLDQQGLTQSRRLDFGDPNFLNPQYELVVLHPEHFLPVGSVLTCYDPVHVGHLKMYVPSPDRRLRESPGDLAQPAFPPFSAPNRRPGAKLNPFLVIIDAEIKFRRYHHLQPPSRSLPEDVLELMKQTAELVELIYWQPEAKPGSYAEAIKKSHQALKRNLARTARLQPVMMQESDMQMDMSSDVGDMPRVHHDVHGPMHRRARPWPEGADLSTRIEMGTAMISGHNLEYTSEDEAFLESLHSQSSF